MTGIQKTLTRWKAPIALSALMLTAYGLMLPSLGYSFDDWNFVYYATRGIEGFKEVFHYDGHPQAIWSYLVNSKLLGYAPLHWHLLSLFWRWVAVITFWALLSAVWQKNERENFFAAALFALHPIYNLQVFSITYYEIWIGYTFIFLSFFFTIKAIRVPERKNLFIALAIFFRIAVFFTKEYAWFVELMRPALIWFAISQENALKKKLAATIKNWAPHIAIFAATVLWRGFFYTPTRKGFQVDSQLLKSPLNMIVQWALNIIPDITIVLFTSWQRILKADFLYFMRPFNLAIFGASIFFGIAIYVYLHTTQPKDEKNTDQTWARAAFWIGVPSLLFGIVPFYIAQYTLHQTEFPFNARFAIGMLPGAALITAAFFEYILTEPRKKILAIAILLSLLTTWHIRYTNDFRKVWAYQEKLLTEITWRVPGIEENTALFIYKTSQPKIDIDSPANLAIFGDFPAARAINTVYETNPEEQGNQLAYWTYFSLSELDDLSQITPLKADHATTSFEGSTDQILVFLFSPEAGQCLHLVQAGDEQYKRYPEPIKNIAPYLSSERISLDNTMQSDISAQLFGDNKANWCYYYESADLAKENQNWAFITALWEDASQSGFQPKHGTELIPFIEAFAQESEWNIALQLTQNANKLSHAMSSTLCPAWQNIANSTLSSTEKEAAIEKAYRILDCSP